jgi:RimK family alpha-L-glutamate ligase
MSTNKTINLCIVGRKYKKSGGSESVRLIGEAAEEMGIQVTNIPIGEIKARLVNNEVEFYSDNVNLSSQDAFIFRGITGLKDKTTDTRVRTFPFITMFARYVHEQLGKVVFDSALLESNGGFTKFVAADKLAKAKLPNIPTWMFINKSEVIKSLDSFPYPVLVKPMDGAQGKGVYKFKTKDEFLKYLKEEHIGSVFYPNMIQQYIENDGDYRIVVLGNKVITALKKKRDGDKVVANMSQGNEAIPVDIDSELEHLALNAAKALNIELAGVDVIEDVVTKKKYILEVNMSPQIYYTSMFSNKNIAQEIITYIVNKVHGHSN